MSSPETTEMPWPCTCERTDMNTCPKCQPDNRFHEDALVSRNHIMAMIEAEISGWSDQPWPCPDWAIQ